MTTDQDPPTVLLSRRRRRRAWQGFWFSLFVLAVAGGASLSTAVGSAVPQLIGVGAISVLMLSIITWFDATFAMSESWARRRREAKQLEVLRAQTQHLCDRQAILKQAEANRIKYQMKRGV
jgi:protein-S-isoprenylcysteine O-methyltransferase Ste14